MKPGDTVEIRSNRYHEIIPGDTGTLYRAEPSQGKPGWFVTLHAKWYVAGGDRGQTIEEARHMWFPTKEIRRHVNSHHHLSKRSKAVA